MLIVGERINSSRTGIARAIEERDSSFIQEEAIKQVQASATHIDVNAGALANKEAECLAWLVQTVQDAVDRPLCIDSPDTYAMRAALSQHRGKAILNSISARKERYQGILPLLKEYGCGVVALCQDDSGIPSTMQEKLDIVSRLIEGLTSEGIALKDIYIDPAIEPISVSPKSALVVLETVERVMANYPGVHTICGLSNISFGLPSRKQLNQTFMVMLMTRGLDSVILDPCDQRLMANVLAADALLGKDEYCLNYIDAHRKGKLPK